MKTFLIILAIYWVAVIVSTYNCKRIQETIIEH